MGRRGREERDTVESRKLKVEDQLKRRRIQCPEKLGAGGVNAAHRDHTEGRLAVRCGRDPEGLGIGGG